MKSAGWYFMKGGQRVWAATKVEIRRLAQLAADELGKAVTVRPATSPASRASRPASKAKRTTMRRNPDPGSILDVLIQQQKGRVARQDYLARTKGQRMAKHLRHRDPAAAKEAGRAKTAKFKVTAVGKRDRFELYRPSRAQANVLVRQFEAAGYRVQLQEV